MHLRRRGGRRRGRPTLIKPRSATEPIESHLVIDRSRPTTRKVRFVSEHHSTHLLRADWEQAKPVAPEIEQAVIDAALGAAAGRRGRSLRLRQGRADGRVVRTLIDAARAAGKPVIVDPKGTDFTNLRGATLITPNRHELAEVSRRPVASEPRSRRPSPSSIASSKPGRAGDASEQGMTLYGAGAEAGPRSRAFGARCATSRAPATPWSRCLRAMLATGAVWPTSMRPTPAPRWWSASAARRPFRPPSCVRACCRTARTRPRTRSCSTGRCSTSISPNGAPGPAHRLHQRLLRSAASRPHQAADRRAAPPATG